MKKSFLLILVALMLIGQGASAQSITLTMINTQSQTDAGTITNGDIVDLASFPNQAFAVRADVSNFSTGSVLFGLDGNANFQMENVFPYTLHGEKAGNPNSWQPALGQHTITATAFSSSRGQGTQGPTTVVTFTVVSGQAPAVDCHGDAGGTAFIDDCGECVSGNTGKAPNAAKDNCGVCYGDGSSCAGTCTGNEIVSLTLMKAGNAGSVGVLTNGYVIDKAVIGDFSIQADPCSGPVGSVLFSLNGNTLSVENIAPYAINGDNSNGFKAWNIPVGNYSLVATPYSNRNASGTAGVSETVNFSVVNGTGGTVDCNGDAGGSAIIDDCGVCSGGNTGKVPNADKDDCGVCNGNNEDKDCNGDCFGTATLDNCGVCSGGNTGVTPNAGCGNSGCVELQVVDLTLINTTTGQDVKSLANGDVIDRGQIANFSIRADVCNNPVGSVVFSLNSNVIQTESMSPYAINGDNSSGYTPWNVAAGSYTLTATPYSNGGGNGTAGVAYSVSFTVKDAPLPVDCNGDAGGSAFIDDCGICAGGNTGKVPNADKDNCGVCFGDGSSCSGSAGCGDFIENNGLVVVEVESQSPANNNWYVGTGNVNGLNIPSPSGTYYMWKAFCGSAPSYSGCTGTDRGSDNNAMTYTIKINNPGRYRFQMRSWQPGIKYGSHSAGSENNDFWLQLPDGGGVKKKGSTEINFGNTEWVKIYQNTTTQWVWRTTTVDNNPHDIYVDFPSVGTYRVKIGARSKLMALDRFVLYRSGNSSNNVSESGATSAMPAESNRGACNSVEAHPGSSTFDAHQYTETPGGAKALSSDNDMEAEAALANQMDVFPNPSKGTVNIRLQQQVTGEWDITVFNQVGQTVQRIADVDANQLTEQGIQLTNLRPGMYLIQLQHENKVYKQKLIVR